MAKVLLIETDPAIRDLLRALLDRYRHRVLTASHSDEALALAYEEDPDIVVKDPFLPFIRTRHRISAVRV